MKLLLILAFLVVAGFCATYVAPTDATRVDNKESTCGSNKDNFDNNCSINEFANNKWNGGSNTEVSITVDGNSTTRLTKQQCLDALKGTTGGVDAETRAQFNTNSGSCKLYNNRSSVRSGQDAKYVVFQTVKKSSRRRV